MTGFGSACAHLIKKGKYKSIADVIRRIENINFTDSPGQSLNNLLIVLDEIAKKAKKIGDAQRAFFELSFRELFNEDSDAYLDLTNCWLKAKQKYDTLY